MKVSLAGYNIDSSLIRKLNAPSATPEVISAAYARISRSPKSVTQLREDALKEVGKARVSNQKIIFEMGHASVAEHAVFNFDIIGISRLLTETLESVRLASFTEKSQRYVTFQSEYVIPGELDTPANSTLRDKYTALVEEMFAEYGSSFEKLNDLYKRTLPDLGKTARECKAKEDARYIFPLSTKTQLGMTINARSLENLLKRLDTHPLLEAKQLYKMILDPVRDICPSLVRYTAKDPYEGTFDPAGIDVPDDGFAPDETVRILDMTEDPDGVILAALLFEQTRGDYFSCLSAVGKLDSQAREGLWEQVFAGIKPWHKTRRAFELVDLTLELKMSESCWAQFKRHRMGSFIKQHDPSTNLRKMPSVIDDIERREAWENLFAKIDALKPDLNTVSSHLPRYIRTNADKVKVLARMNLRELYHFVRLRSDEHAQWEIRALSDAIASQIRRLCPASSSLLCGKSEMQV